MDLSRELEVAARAVADAAALVTAVYARDFGVAWKAADDPVTEADRGANALLVARLRAAFPDDGICAEESDLQESARAAARGGRCWFVDPLDGTREFVRKSGEFCVMAGLALGGRAVLGAVCAPAWRRSFLGVFGGGAWEHGEDGVRRPLRVAWPEDRDPGRARQVVSRLHRNAAVDGVTARLGIGSESVRVCGSTGLKLVLVATGAADLYVHTGPGPQLWDGCAPEAIARAAGAEVCDAAGRPLRYDTDRLPLDRGIVAGPGPLVRRVLPLLRADSAPTRP